MMRCPTGCRTCQDELQAIRRNEKLAASILWQLREDPTLSICAVDSEKWHREDGYDPTDDDLPELCLVSATASGSAKQRVTRREPQPGETR
jgi:hypothetical protein